MKICQRHLRVSRSGANSSRQDRIHNQSVVLVFGLRQSPSICKVSRAHTVSNHNNKVTRHINRAYELKNGYIYFRISLACY